MNTTTLKTASQPLTTPNTNATSTTTPPPAPKRMTITNARRGIIIRPPRIMLYGLEKVGKTTFAKGAPSPIWLGKDQGTEHLNITRYPQPNSWTDVLDALDDMAKNGKANGFETLVIDPVNYMEPLAVADIVGNSGKSLADWGAYGKGTETLLERFRRFVAALERVWDAGHGIVLLAHSRVKQFDNPEGASYKRYEIDMSDRVAGLLRQWVDCVVFAQRESFARVDENRKVRGAGSGARMMHTEWTAAYDAGNRWDLEPLIPLSWADLMASKANGIERRARLLKQIETHLVEIADPAVSAKVEAFLADGADIMEVANKIEAKLAAVREERGAGATDSGSGASDENNGNEQAAQ